VQCQIVIDWDAGQNDEGETGHHDAKAAQIEEEGWNWTGELDVALGLKYDEMIPDESKKQDKEGFDCHSDTKNAILRRIGHEIGESGRTFVRWAVWIHEIKNHAENSNKKGKNASDQVEVLHAKENKPRDKDAVHSAEF
jgi:hypothetical protein